MGVGSVFLLHTALYLEGVIANSTTAVSGHDTTDVSKAFISLTVLGAAFLIAFIVAKVVDYFYDRAALRDDASDISEHTRQLIRARLALSRFKRPLKKKKKKKKKNEKESKKNAKAFFNIWSKNAKARRSHLKSDIVINVEEARSGDQLQVNGGFKKPPHVTFVDEFNPHGQDGHGTVLSIPVPSLKPKTGSEEIPSISARVAEKENGMVPTKDISSKPPNPRDSPTAVPRSGRASPSKDYPGKGSTSGQGRTTPNGETRTTTVSGRTTPVMPRAGSAATGRTTPVVSRAGSAAPGRSTPVMPRAGTGGATAGRTTPVMPRAGTGSATAGRTTPVMPRIGTGTGVRSTPIMPRAGTATGNNKAKVTASPSRPKTAPSPKPGHKVVSVKSALVKTPSTPKLSAKPTQTKK